MSLSRAPLTIALLVTNIGVYLWMLTTPIVPQEGVHRLMLLGAIRPVLVAHGEYYRIITAGFLQFNLQHILFNMYALAQAGMVVENLYGSVKYFVIYMGALVAGGVAAYVTTIGTDQITAGASGAIMGLFGAIFALGLKTPALRQTLVGWALLPIIATLAVGFSVSGISNAGHIGGVIAGAVIGLVLPARRVNQFAAD